MERYLEAGHVDGAILVRPHGNDPLPARLDLSGVPIVLSGRAKYTSEPRRKASGLPRGRRGLEDAHRLSGRERAPSKEGLRLFA